MERDPAETAVPAAAETADVVALRAAILDKMTYVVGKHAEHASDRDWFVATATAVRDRLVDRWTETRDEIWRKHTKRVYYLSLEFLIGRLLFDAMSNLCMVEPVREALAGLGVDLDRLRDIEPDAALGNGGLGRLAACFMESLSSLGLAAHGYGIRYDHGLFRQRIKDGWQLEYPETWLSFGNPWEFPRPESSYSVGFGGRVEAIQRPDGTIRHVWHPAETVEAMAYDTPIPGWRGRHVNTLRLWSARAPDPLRLDAFNRGDHVGALAAQVKAEAISKILYPSDATPEGLELRLRQEYFFVSASLQDLINRHLRQHDAMGSLADMAAIQLNDTHPAIGIAEMMRLLVDVHHLEWEEAWGITSRTFSYTNHTLLPEALETWPVPLMERLLPRHMQIIYLINALHLDKLRKAGETSNEVLSSLSLIDEQSGRRVRMGHLAFIGSHKINGVSALHTDLMRTTVFRELNRAYPGRIVNKTNGITFRRWLYQANPGLTDLIVEACGERVLDRTEDLEKLAALADDRTFQRRAAAVKRANKVALGRVIAEQLGIKVDPDALFDVQIKRIHEYKRQLLNILETIAVYEEIRSQPMRDWIPRVKIFAGKAAASYHQAKLIIKLANDVAKVVNADPTVRGLLKVAFLPNYNVSLAETIIPAADLSEQISTAGMEASGTGNMKLALNGALTIGTLDGANVEIRERVGPENIFIFGMTAEEVEQRRRQGIDSRAAIQASPRLPEILDAIASGVFSPDDPDRYRGLVDAITYHDYFMVSADFDAYYATQRNVYRLWRNREAWMRASLLNTARMGWFSSDRAITEYAREIWNVALDQQT
ncbi:glycogen/starch/alpha-glucan phosphorylase [Prosthecomicrobium sp. N25]|uniref:glycogen/starch/alpha-glucan phosphorylase n=1 Tax=Prosthecomicrobium sp. N25 TaxID=3129254 RepID=UPI003077A8B1